MRNCPKIHTPPARDATLRPGEPSDFHSRLLELHEAQLNHFAWHAFNIGFRKLWKTSLSLSMNEENFDTIERRYRILATHEWEESAKERRSGIPTRESHQGCRGFICKTNMDALNEGRGEGVTNFLVRKAVYRAFFEPWKPPCKGKSPCL